MNNGWIKGWIICTSDITFIKQILLFLFLEIYLHLIQSVIVTESVGFVVIFVKIAVSSHLPMEEYQILHKE